MQRMRSVSTKNTTLPLWSSIVCNLGRGTEQPDLAIVAQHTLHVNLTVRISSLLPNWAAPNGGEGWIGFATLRAFAPSLRLSVPLRCTNPLLGFASHPSYLIGLRPMAEREGFESSLAANRIHCQSGKPLKHSHHYFRIRASVAQYGTRFGNT